ncbi:hypothetical protein [Vibrio atlanticus]|jgi:hypothetical protein|uniref:hypothetical protein n=1 Tax=Vibrio atlanticus TaxID=693153 RepID=UPI003D148391
MTISRIKLEELAKKLEDRICNELKPVNKEKILIGGLNAAGFQRFYYFLNENWANYPNLLEVMDVYVAPNFSKQEERDKRLNGKRLLGDFIANNHESMKVEQITELKKVFTRM